MSSCYYLSVFVYPEINLDVCMDSHCAVYVFLFCEEKNTKGHRKLRFP